MQERNDGFWLNVVVAALILGLTIFCAKVAMASEVEDIQAELITNLEKQVEKQKEINVDNEKIIEGNKKIIEM